MENIVNKLKSYFSSNFGKLTAIISGLTFIITLMLSVAFKNRIDISVFKALISAIITMAILYGLNIALIKYLGNIIENSDVETVSGIADNSLGNNSNAYSAEENGLQTSNDSDILTKSKSENSSDSILEDIPKPKETIKNDFNIDKNNKVDYPNLRGDIGDIILNTPSYNNLSNIQDTNIYYNSDRKVNEKNMEREIMDDPEKTAIAIRTMIAKDKGNEKKES